MTEWDKLCDAFYTELKKKKEERSVFELLKIFNEVRAEGDKLQRTIATGYCGECDIHKEKLEASQEALGKTFNKLADEQQKLEAIREIASDLVKSNYELQSFAGKEILGVLSEEGNPSNLPQKEVSK